MCLNCPIVLMRHMKIKALLFESLNPYTFLHNIPSRIFHFINSQKFFIQERFTIYVSTELTTVSLLYTKTLFGLVIGECRKQGRYSNTAVTTTYSMCPAHK